MGPSPDPTRDLICSVFSSGVKFDDFVMGCLPDSVQLLIKSLRGCSGSFIVGLGERHTVTLVKAYLLNNLLDPTKAARVIEKTTASGMKESNSKRLTEGKGSPVGRVQHCDNESLRSLLFCRHWR